LKSLNADSTEQCRTDLRAEKRLSIKNKTTIRGFLSKIDAKAITLQTKGGDTVAQAINRKTAVALQRVKAGTFVILVTRKDDDVMGLDDACWRVGNSACGGSENDPCPSPDERQIYYKCVDDQGNELYYNECEAENCPTKKSR